MNKRDLSACSRAQCMGDERPCAGQQPETVSAISALAYYAIAFLGIQRRDGRCAQPPRKNKRRRARVLESGATGFFARRKRCARARPIRGVEEPPGRGRKRPIVSPNLAALLWIPRTKRGGTTKEKLKGIGRCEPFRTGRKQKSDGCLRQATAPPIPCYPARIRRKVQATKG